MSFVLKLKRDPVWLDLSLNTGCGVVSLLSVDGHNVSVPAAVLLAASPLLRSMVCDLHPAAHGPLILSIAISGDVMLLVGDILTKGVAFVKGDMMKGEVQEGFKMMGVDVFLDSFVLDEVVLNSGRSDSDRNDEIKLEILVKLESLDENTTEGCILNKKKNLEELSKDSNASNVVDNMRISTVEDYSQQGADGGLNLKIVSLKSINIEAFKDDVNLQVVQPMRSRKSTEKTQTQKPAGEKLFKCDDCEYSTELRNSIEKHKRTHSGEKPFQCEHCDYFTARSDSLLLHTRIQHSGVKQSKLICCEYCDYSTASRGGLAIHVRKHTVGEKPLKCEDCDYSTDVRNNLERHKRAHSGEKPFLCEHCDYSSARRDNLMFHTRKHTGAKLSYCEYCDYSTAHSSILAIHVRTHTGEKPFKCDDCDYRNATSHGIVLHKRIHTGEKTYKCDSCDFRAPKRRNITIHKKAKHTVVKPCQM